MLFNKHEWGRHYRYIIHSTAMHHIIDRGDVKQETTNLELLMADSGQVGVTQCITIMCLFIYPMYDHNR